MIRDLERVLRRHPMPELVGQPVARGPRGRSVGGGPALAAAAGGLLVAGLVLAARAPGDQLGTPAGMAMAITGWLTVVLGLPPALVVLLLVRPRNHRRMRRAAAAMNQITQDGSGPGVPPPRRPAPIALVSSSPADVSLTWQDTAELVDRRAAVERWAQVGRRSAVRLQPWWQLLLVLVLFVTPLTWCGVAVAQEALTSPA